MLEPVAHLALVRADLRVGGGGRRGRLGLRRRGGATARAPGRPSARRRGRRRDGLRRGGRRRGRRRGRGGRADGDGVAQGPRDTVEAGAASSCGAAAGAAGAGAGGASTFRSPQAARASTRARAAVIRASRVLIVSSSVEALTLRAVPQFAQGRVVVQVGSPSGPLGRGLARARLIPGWTRGRADGSPSHRRRRCGRSPRERSSLAHEEVG